MIATITELDDFTRAYLEAILFAETDNADDSGGEPLDRNYDLWDFDSDSLEKAIEDCRRFQEENAADLARYDHPQWSAAELGGHDFWLDPQRARGRLLGPDGLPAGRGARSPDGRRRDATGEKTVGVGDDGNLYID